MKKIVSVSLGSSKRDHEVEVELLGEKFNISRHGTDGDFNKARKILKELDGNVDAIGLGGLDVYVYSKSKRYTFNYGMKLFKTVKETPVVDGSGLKNSLERSVIQKLADDPRFTLKHRNCLLVCGMDRFGMAESLVEAGCNMIFGDLVFALDVDKPLKTLDELEEQADKLFPEISRLPIGFVYPTGNKQETYAELDEKHTRLYEWADIIAGDFHYIRRHLTPRLDGRDIITNTVTNDDIEILKEKGVRYLVTTTPELKGRSFGTNVLEAALISILNKPWEDITREDYQELIDKLGLEPRIVDLNPDRSKEPVMA
ncbi:MAG: quinate 5-dehydrogenase [Vulcanimicrobiota bacterium]